MAVNMSDIARLAGVRRPVVSMWRSRYATGEHPFPAPLPHPGDRGAVLFDEDQIIAWLQVTGRGHNPTPALDLPLHSTEFATLAAHPDEASALILLHHLTQAPLHTLSPAEVDEALMLAQLPDEFLPMDLDLTDPGTAALVPHVDAVVEAAFTAGAALERLVESFGVGSDAWGESLLSAPARRLVAAILHEMRPEPAVPLVPTSLGALAVLTRTITEVESNGPREFVALTRRLRTDRERATWRLLAALGHHVRTVTTSQTLDDDAPLTLPHTAAQAITVLDPAADTATVAAELRETTRALGPTSSALVLGPASLLTDATGAAERRVLLRETAESGVSLRYVAALPMGVLTRSIRRRLALWVLAGPDVVKDHGKTVVSDLGGRHLTDGVVQAVAADVAATLQEDSSTVHTHAFLTGGPLAADAVREARSMTAPRTAGGESPRLGSDLLAEAGHADPDFVSAIAARAARTARAEERVSWAEMSAVYGRDRSGLRLPAEELTASGAGTVAAIGAEELRGATPWGTRRIDRLRLEEIASKAQFTERGDVLYVAAGGPAAVVDDVGGHLVLAPVRVFRAGEARAVGDGMRQAVPGLVAADIAAQQVPDKSAWRIRLADPERAAEIETLRREAAARRSALEDQLDRLNRAEQALMRGLAAGTVRVNASAGRHECTETTTLDDAGTAEAAPAGDEEQ